MRYAFHVSMSFCGLVLAVLLWRLTPHRPAGNVVLGEGYGQVTTDVPNTQML